MAFSFSVAQLFVIVVVLVLYVWPYWRIFRRAGFPPWLGILMVIPVVNFVMLFVLAFARWPALEPKS